jgi:hypothetical protein
MLSKLFTNTRTTRNLFTKGIIAVLIAMGITYYGKSTPSKPMIVRTHGVLGWHLPTQNGFSTLLVLADDNNDSNDVKSGHRIWFNPPAHPELLAKDFTYFAGPSISVIGDSIKLSSLNAIANTVDSSGFLFIHELKHTNICDSLKPLILNQSIQVECIEKWPGIAEAHIGSDANVHLWKHSMWSRLEVVQNKHQFEYLMIHTASKNPLPPLKGSILGLNTLNPLNNYSIPQKQIVIHTAEFDEKTLDRLDTSLLQNLSDKSVALIFYEENNEERKLLARKVKMKHWADLEQ